MMISEEKKNPELYIRVWGSLLYLTEMCPDVELTSI